MAERECRASGCIDGKVSWVKGGKVVTMNCVACNGTGKIVTPDTPKK